ncbi:glycosyltransferase family protein [Nisaea sediminum]|uniref:hypothetical protein n=1 Tax=Nisaea sediminum TaxID=2775867 RepID=UPI001868F1C9|nr:hypothetical protein [Nisaea sediminum]
MTADREITAGDYSVLIVNSHPRETLLKQIRSLRSQGFEGQIVVTDGRNEPFDDSSELYTNVVVVHIPLVSQDLESRAGNFFERIYKGVLALESERIVLCPSDDLMDLEAVRMAFAFLDRDSSFATCAMNSIRVQGAAARRYRQIPVTQEHWTDRISFHAIGGSSFFWAAHRKSILSRTLRFITELNFPAHAHCEHLFHFLILLQGKVNVIDKLGIVKDFFDDSLPQTGQEGIHDIYSKVYWEILLSGSERTAQSIGRFLPEIGLGSETDRVIDFVLKYHIGFGALRIDRFDTHHINDKRARFQYFESMVKSPSIEDLMKQFRSLVPKVSQMRSH